MKKIISIAAVTLLLTSANAMAIKGHASKKANACCTKGAPCCTKGAACCTKGK